MNTIALTTYQTPLVVLSYVISVAGSFVALMAARRLMAARGRARIAEAATAGLALGGIGVWSMHFIGMLALRLQMGVAYSMWETLLSLLAAVGATAAALAYVAAAPWRLSRVIGAGVLLGMGVVAMHYLGMSGMRFGGHILWSYGIIALSVLIAVAAAIAALWLAFNTRTWIAQIASAFVMGVAVCAMHYTAMTAATFICTTTTPRAIPNGLGIVSALELPVWVSGLAILTVVILALVEFLRYVDDTELAAAQTGLARR